MGRVKVECKVSGFHPATGLDLIAGEMEVSEEQAAQLERAGFLATKRQRAAPVRPEKEKEG
jgi:hypothetical protein